MKTYGLVAGVVLAGGTWLVSRAIERRIVRHRPQTSAESSSAIAS